jgi:hypothetical protein
MKNCTLWRGSVPSLLQKRLVLFSFALVAVALCARSEAVGGVVFTASGHDNDGSVSATIEFTAVAGGLDVTITNTATGSIAKGQAVSGFSFNVSGFSVPTGFTELKGGNLVTSGTLDSLGSWTATTGTAFDDVDSTAPFNLIDHWGFQTTGSNGLVATAGSPTASGNPLYMILPSTGTVADGNALSNSNFDPFVIGPADFFLTVPGMTASTVLGQYSFSNVIIEFGTGPDTSPTATYTGMRPTASPAPEPMSLVVWSILGTFGACYAFRRNRQRAA